MAKTNFEILGEMSNKGMDIAMMPDMVRMNLTKRGGEVTMGVPTEHFMTLMQKPNDYHFLLFTVNQNEYEQIKNS